MLTALVDGLHTRDRRVTLVLDDWQRVTGAGARDLFTAALDTARATMGPAAHATRLASALLGQLRYETGDLDVAADLLAQSRELSAEGGGGVDFMLATYATGARVRTLRGDHDGARELLEEGMSHAEHLDLPAWPLGSATDGCAWASSWAPAWPRRS